MKLITLEWKLARRELDNYTDVNTVNLRKSSLQNIKENAKKTKSNTPVSSDCCPPRPRLSDLAFTSAGEFVLNQVTFELPEGFRNAPLSQNAATCFGSLLPGAPPSLQPPPRQAPLSWERGAQDSALPLTLPLPVPAPSQALTSTARPGRHLNQSPRYWVEITVAFSHVQDNVCKLTAVLGGKKAVNN